MKKSLPVTMNPGARPASSPGSRVADHPNEVESSETNATGYQSTTTPVPYQSTGETTPVTLPHQASSGGSLNSHNMNSNMCQADPTARPDAKVKSILDARDEGVDRQPRQSDVAVMTDDSSDLLATVPSNLGTLVESICRDYQEAGRKIQQLLAAFNSLSMPENTNPAQQNVMMTGSQQTMSFQRELEWRLPLGGLRQGVHGVQTMSTCSRIPQSTYGLETIPQCDEKTTRHYKTLLMVANRITDWDDLKALATWLNYPTIVDRLRSENHSILSSTQTILRLFYNSVPDNERWSLLIEALHMCNHGAAVMELGIDKLQQEAQMAGADNGHQIQNSAPTTPGCGEPNSTDHAVDSDDKSVPIQTDVSPNETCQPHDMQDE